MTNQIEQALKHLEKWLNDNDKTKLNEWRSHMVKEAFIGGYKAALEALEKCEPVIIDSIASGIINGKRQILPMGAHYYTSPQPREWVSLSDTEKVDIYNSVGEGYTLNFKDLCDEIEAKLKQLNTKG